MKIFKYVIVFWIGPITFLEQINYLITYALLSRSLSLFYGWIE